MEFLESSPYYNQDVFEYLLTLPINPDLKDDNEKTIFHKGLTKYKQVLSDKFIGDK